MRTDLSWKPESADSTGSRLENLDPTVPRRDSQSSVYRWTLVTKFLQARSTPRRTKLAQNKPAQKQTPKRGQSDYKILRRKSRALRQRNKLLPKPPLNLHLRPLNLARPLQQLNKIIQVDYGTESRIFPRSLVNLVRVNHVPTRIVSEKNTRRVRLQDLRKLPERVPRLLQLVQSPV